MSERDEELKKQIHELYLIGETERDSEWYYQDKKIAGEIKGRIEMKKEIEKIIENWNCQNNPVIERTMNTLIRRIKEL